MPISAPDLVNMRTGNPVSTPHLNVAPLVVAATMRVDQSFFTWPLATLTVDDVSMNGSLAFADIPVGSLVWIGTTALSHDALITATRKAPSGTSLFINGLGPGDAGEARLDFIRPADDYYITIFANKGLISMFSRIASGVFYKRYDVAYTDEGSSPDPVCNIGPWRRLVLTGSEVSDTFTNAAITDVKPASFAWGSKTISSYAWTTRNEDFDENTGAAFDGGTDDTEGVTIDFDTTGFYIVQCTITDSDSKTHTGECYVWVVDGETDDLTKTKIKSDKQDRTGREMEFERWGNTTETEIYPGAASLYTEEQSYNGTTVTAGATVNSFAGFIQTETLRRVVTHGITTFKLVSPSVLLQDVPNAAQYMSEESSPSTWTGVTSDLSHPSGAAWYILQHHCPQVLQLFDFDPLIDPNGGAMDTGMRKKTWLFANKSIWGQLKEIVPHQINIGCRSSGGLVMRHYPNLMTSWDRDYVDERMEWTEADIREEITWTRVIKMPVGIVDGYAFTYNGSTITPFWARSPGDLQPQGTNTDVYNGMVVPAIDAQVTLNYLTGNLFAQANAAIKQLVIRTVRNMDTADPALMRWHTIALSLAYEPRQRGVFTDRRILPHKVNRRWRQTPTKSWAKRTDITFTPETSGEAALTKQVPESTENDWNSWDDWFDPYEWPVYEDAIIPDWWGLPTSSINTMAAITSDGSVWQTGDFTTTDAMGQPSWVEQAAVMPAGANACQVFVVDAASPLYKGTGTSLDGFAASLTGIYKLEDLLGTPTATLKHSFAATAQDVNMDFSFAHLGWGVCVYRPSGASVKVTYTRDYGETWSSEVAPTAHYCSSGIGIGQIVPGLMLSQHTEGLVYVGAWSSTGSITTLQGSLYKSTDYGATWASATGDFNINFDNGLGMELHIPYAQAAQDTMWYTRTNTSSFKSFTAEYYANSVTSTGAGTPNGYGPSEAHQTISSYPLDDNYMAMYARKISLTGDVTNTAHVYTSNDGGATWTTRASWGIYGYGRVAIAGDNPAVLYVWGANQTLLYSDDYGATLDDRGDDIFAGSTKIIGLAGGIS